MQEYWKIYEKIGEASTADLLTLEKQRPGKDGDLCLVHSKAKDTKQAVKQLNCLPPTPTPNTQNCCNFYVNKLLLIKITAILVV